MDNKLEEKKKPKHGVAMDKERNKKIRESRAEGKTLKQIGIEFDMSRERVRQILRTMDREDKIPGGMETIKKILQRISVTARAFKVMPINNIEKIEGITEEEIRLLLIMKS